MDISIVILTYNEEKNIGDCLGSVLKQNCFPGQWEVLVIDGLSQDNTVKIIEGYRKNFPNLSLVENPERHIAAGRNLGIKESRYPFIAFTDADCIVPGEWLLKLSCAYEKLSRTDNKIAAVGGGNVPPQQGAAVFHKALGVYLDSFLGCFNSAQGRNFAGVKKVNSLACANVLYDKQKLAKIGGFDNSRRNICEDFDINLRLRTAGYNLYFVPQTAVVHKLRPDLSGWLRNMAVYGRGRAMITFKYKLFFTPFFILPLCFSLAMLLTPLGFANRIFFWPLVYFPAICFYAAALTLKKKFGPVVFLNTLVIFITTHFVYAFNLLFKSLQIVAGLPRCKKVNSGAGNSRA